MEQAHEKGRAQRLQGRTHNAHGKVSRSPRVVVPYSQRKDHLTPQLGI